METEITDSQRLDWLESNMEQVYRRMSPSMGGNDVILAIRKRGNSPEQRHFHHSTIRNCVDMAILDQLAKCPK